MRQIWCWIWTRRRRRYNLNYWKSISHRIVIVHARSIRISTTRYSMFCFVMSPMDRMWLIFPNKYFRGIQQWKERQFWMNGFRYERWAQRSFAGPQFESRSRKGTRKKNVCWWTFELPSELWFYCNFDLKYAAICFLKTFFDDWSFNHTQTHRRENTNDGKAFRSISWP